jgi:hypothetical protein
MPSFEAVIDVVREERTYQHDKWGTGGQTSSLIAFIAMQEAYLAEAKNLATHHDMSDLTQRVAVLDIQRKVTALGVASMEAHGATHRT